MTHRHPAASTCAFSSTEAVAALSPLGAALDKFLTRTNLQTHKLNGDVVDDAGWCRGAGAGGAGNDDELVHIPAWGISLQWRSCGLCGWNEHGRHADAPRRPRPATHVRTARSRGHAGRQLWCRGLPCPPLEGILLRSCRSRGIHGRDIGASRFNSRAWAGRRSQDDRRRWNGCWAAGHACGRQQVQRL